MGLPSGRVGLKFRADGAAGPVYAGADSILSAYITTDTPIRWTPLAEKLGGLDLEKQHKIEAILGCLVETI